MTENVGRRWTAVGVGIAAVVTLAGCQTAGSADASAPGSKAAASEAEIYVVAMRADWCPPCKVLEPRVNEAVASFDGSVQPVVADYTRRINPAAKDELAAWDLEWLHERNGGTTGRVYIVDVDTNQTLDEFGGTAIEADEIESRIRAALARAS